jgi:hypothetical protein
VKWSKGGDREIVCKGDSIEVLGREKRGASCSSLL